MIDKTKKNLMQVVMILILVGISALAGDYAAVIMSTSTIVKNSMVCQILVILGFIAGSVMVLIFQELDRRYPVVLMENCSEMDLSRRDKS
jgi:hypothetical protein